MRLVRASRLTREADLEAVRVQGKRIRTAQVEVRYLASPLRRPRVGVIVPRFSHSAVERNLVKRRLRELIRMELLPALAARDDTAPATGTHTATEGSLDVVIRAAPSAYQADYDTLRAAVRRAIDRIRQSTAGEGRERQ
ncbi:MAG: ribonuclease P protein component [Gemmatimonas sp.]|nr:ribonuclease P protein component [Gemmatimonas sp.]